MGRPKLEFSFCQRHQEYRVATHHGRKWTCRSCSKIDAANHYARNKSEIYARRRVYQIAKAREWQAAHPERHRANKRAFHRRHREKQSAIHKLYYLKNKAVIDARVNAWNRKHPDVKASRDRQTRYGATVEKWRAAQMLVQQGCCAFCHRTEAELGRRLHTDHDHKFDRHDSRGWRRLLCSNCNTLYGLAREIPEVLSEAAEAARLDALRDAPEKRIA